MELAGGAWIFLAVVIVCLIGTIIGLYTRQGSGIDQHPYRKVYGGAPGADLPDRISGSDRTSVIEEQAHAKRLRRRAARDRSRDG